MSAIEIIILSFGLSLDAFAVSICKGLATEKITNKNALTCGIYFGLFQGMMPLLGFLLCSSFSSYIEAFDHWIAFILLALIGANMIKESFKEESLDANYSFKAMLPLAIATSIDALAVGVSFAFLKLNIGLSVLTIGLITFATSTLGAKLGAVLGAKFKQKAEIAGGIILILIGSKILLEHLGLLPF